MAEGRSPEAPPAAERREAIRFFYRAGYLVCLSLRLLHHTSLSVIERPVIIATIAILVGTLLPGLSKAKAKAQTSVYLANLKRLPIGSYC